MKQLITGFLLVPIFLAGCASLPGDRWVSAPAGQYDTVIVDPDTGRPLSIEQLARHLADIDIVVVGEYHGHHASHLLQARLQQALHQQNPRQILSMEQFNLDQQAGLDAYLAGQTGESEMLEDTGAWDNYKGSYRPLVEYARQHQIPVIAANAPATTVRCVARQGAEYIGTLPPPARAALPEQVLLDTPGYRTKFVEAISGSHGANEATLEGQLLNTYQAQLLRDNTMAHRILTGLAERPGHQLLHLTGTFHSEHRLGTVAVLEQRAPGQKIAVISPVEWPPTQHQMPLLQNRQKGDYLYFVQPLPAEFRDTERERNAMKARFHNRASVDCDQDRE
ncbi:MAG TPA: ChaN family lipoprotein [Marinobacter sp.]|nr:ChaN family lipoprotein [Marinobacter sp.]